MLIRHLDGLDCSIMVDDMDCGVWTRCIWMRGTARPVRFRSLGFGQWSDLKPLANLRLLYPCQNFV